MTLLTRRNMLHLGLIAPLAAPLAACSVSPILRDTGESLALAVTGLKNPEIDPAYVRDLPYASLLADLGRGPRSLLVLAEQQGSRLTWVAADRGVLVTDNGRLIKTAGFGKDLSYTSLPNGDHLAKPMAIGGGILTEQAAYVGPTRYVDYQYKQRFNLAVTSTVELRDNETIDILDRQHECLVYREKNHCEALGWTFTNTFWRDAKTGFVWQSEQQTDPDLPAFTLQVGKPVG